MHSTNSAICTIVSGQENGSSRRDSKKVSYTSVLTLAYQSLGVVYGDLSTSPLYVYKTTFSGKLSLHEDDDEVYGVLSFIFWIFTIIALIKYAFIVLSADDNGEGGAFALYSLLTRHAKLGILPNEHETCNDLTSYSIDGSRNTSKRTILKSFSENCLKFRIGLLIFVLLGTCMTVGAGVFTPAISVLSAVSGVQVKLETLHENYVVIISCIILVGLFYIQHHGTSKVAFLFAPIVLAWLLSISSIGVYNIIKWNPHIYRALSPHYMYKFLKETGHEGWVSLGGVVLAITGVEAMFAALGHFSTLSIKIAFTAVVYPCLMLAYLGEAAYLSKHHEDIQRSFYKAIPGNNFVHNISKVSSCYASLDHATTWAEPVFWPVFVVATLAAVVGSQAAISATFSIISQCSALHCFPRVKIVHTSSKIYGQIYIPEVNWILMCLCLAVTIGLRDTNKIGHAYGLAVTIVMFVTTILMAMVMIIVWNKTLTATAAFLIFFGSVELLYMTAAFCKVLEGGWMSLLLSFVFMVIMFSWNYGTLKKHQFDVDNKVSVDRILSLGPSLGMVRVPGISLVYTNLTTGIPAIFGHFVTNLPAFHQVLIFVCVKSVQVPRISEKDRFSISRVGPKEFGMYRCILMYGYKDLPHENYEFENMLVAEVIKFVENEEETLEKTTTVQSAEGIENSNSEVFIDIANRYTCLNGEENTMRSIKDIQVMLSENSPPENSSLKDETMHILRARESGMAYILGHSFAKSKKSSSIVKKFAVDIVYNFLSKNCRGPDVVLNVPHTSLLEVGMVYFV